LGRGILLHAVFRHRVFLHAVVLAHLVLSKGRGRERQAERESSGRDAERDAGANGHWFIFPSSCICRRRMSLLVLDGRWTLLVTRAVEFFSGPRPASVSKPTQFRLPAPCLVPANRTVRVRRSIARDLPPHPVSDYQ